VRIAGLFTSLVKEKPTPDGHNLIPGLFSWARMIAMGKEIGATPNGRHAGGPISHGPNPDPGFPQGRRTDRAGGRRGRGAARLRQHGPAATGHGSGLGRDEEGIEKVAALIRAHFALGGTQINLNVMDKQTILEAHQDPSKYPDLVVAGDRLQRLLRQPLARIPADRGGSDRERRVALTPQLRSIERQRREPTQGSRAGE